MDENPDPAVDTDGPNQGHDPAALADAERKMGVAGGSLPEDPAHDDPTGDHDPDALADAARKMNVEP